MEKSNKNLIKLITKPLKYTNNKSMYNVAINILLHFIHKHQIKYSQ